MSFTKSHNQLPIETHFIEYKNWSGLTRLPDQINPKSKKNCGIKLDFVVYIVEGCSFVHLALGILAHLLL